MEMKAIRWQIRGIILANLWEEFKWKHEDIEEDQNVIDSLRAYHQTSRTFMKQLQVHFQFTSSYGNHESLKASPNLKHWV